MAGNQGNYRENPTRNEKKYKKANGQPRLKEKSSRAKSDNVCPYAKKCGGCDYPVSYTHLDVYKRQVQSLGIMKLPQIMENCMMW